MKWNVDSVSFCMCVLIFICFISNKCEPTVTSHTGLWTTDWHCRGCHLGFLEPDVTIFGWCVTYCELGCTWFWLKFQAGRNGNLPSQLNRTQKCISANFWDICNEVTESGFIFVQHCLVFKSLFLVLWAQCVALDRLTDSHLSIKVVTLLCHLFYFKQDHNLQN